MPAEGRENPLLKKGNSDAFFREKYLTKNTFQDSRRSIAFQFQDADDLCDRPLRDFLTELDRHKNSTPAPASVLFLRVLLSYPGGDTHSHLPL